MTCPDGTIKWNKVETYLDLVLIIGGLAWGLEVLSKNPVRLSNLPENLKWISIIIYLVVCVCALAKLVIMLFNL